MRTLVIIVAILLSISLSACNHVDEIEGIPSTDNQTAAVFKTMLPMTAHMNEMNDNEKYFYFPKDLPVLAVNPPTIHSGDIMLYGLDCLVLFYKTVETSYQYTKIGTVNDPTNLEVALGGADVFVKFELIINK